MKNEFEQNYERLQTINIHVKQDKGKIENWGTLDGTPMNIPFPNLTFDIWKAVKISYIDFAESMKEEESLLIQRFYYQLEEIDLYVSDRKNALYALLPRIGEGQINEQIYIKDKNILSLIAQTLKTADEVAIYYFGEPEWESKKQEIDVRIQK